METENLIISHYKILDTIGKGNKGIVYKVYDLFTNKILALKVFFPKINNLLGKKYIEEQFFKLINLNNQNLIKVYDFGITKNEEYYFTMDFIEGKTIKELKKIDEKTLYQIIFQICQALDYLHFNDLIHFNLKPSNIMLVESEPYADSKSPFSLQIKLLDFGLSQYSTIEEKNASEVINYTAPEIIKEKKIDKRVDFYSLGAVLYEVLTGQLPFAEKKLQDIISHYLERQFLSPREINHNISIGMEKIVLRLLSKNPNKRYDNALNIIKEINILMKKNYTHIKEMKILNVFVGRVNEIKILKELLKENIAEKGKLILIRGETGIGKSYLLQRFKSFCQLEKTLLLTGQCDGLYSISYKPIIEILHQLIVALESKQKENIIRKHKKSLTKLIPELKNKKYCKDLVEENLPEKQLPENNKKTILMEEIFTFLIETRKVISYVITIEDSHLADEETLEMIQYFSVNSPLLIILICKDEEINNNKKLTNLTKAFKEDDFYKELILKRFNFTETKLMINLMLQSYSIGEKLVNLVYKNTFGNPFFLREEIISLINEYILYQDEGELVLNEENYKAIKLSSNVKELIETRIKKLDSKTLEILEILSIVRMKIKEDLVRLISEISNLKQKDIQEILDELVLNYILIDNNNLWGFYHRKTRKLLESNISKGKKKILHQKIGEVLENIYKEKEIINNNIEELAYHFVNGSNKEKALSYSLKAAEMTKNIYAYQKTIEHYKNILSISEIYKVKKELASVYKTVGNYDESINCWDEILKDCKDKKERITIHIMIGEIYLIKGNYQKALINFDEGKKELFEFNPPPQKELSLLYKTMGIYYYQHGKLDKAKLECKKSLEILEEKDREEIANIYILLGNIFFVSYDYEKSIMYYNKSLEIGEQIENKILIATCYHNIGCVYGAKEEINEAINHYNKCLKIYKKTIMDKYFLEHIHSNLGNIYLIKKDYDLANFHILESLQLAKKMGYLNGLIINYNSLGNLYHKKGANEIALNYLKKSLTLSSDTTDKRKLLPLYYNLVKVYLDLNKIDESLKYCQKILKSIKKNDSSYRTKRGEIYRTVGLIYQKKKNYQKAEKYFEKSEEFLIEAEKSEQKLELAKTYHCISNLGKKKVEIYLEKTMKTYEELGRINETESTKKELEWIKEERIEDIQKFKVFYEVTQIITSILNLNQLLPIVVDKIIETTKAEKGYLFLSNDKGELDLNIVHTPCKKDIQETSTEINWDIVKKVFEYRKPVLINDIPLKGDKEKNNKHTIMCTLLQTKNKKIGIIYVYSKLKNKIFSNDDFDFFIAFANQIAISIENAILYDTLLKKEKEASEFKTINQLKITPFNVKKAPEEINEVISISEKIFEKNISKCGFGDLIGRNSNMEEIYNLISKVAAYDTTVLILGESGTGKELVSEEIHKLGKRKNGKLVKLNSASLSKDLMESEIFGYEKGAFTGAYKSKKGKLELADKGTLFLDEIGEMPLSLQSKFLRALETKSFYKLGGNTLIHSDFRLIFATNVNLRNMVEKGKFREDLYYRIYKFVIKIPPLRERKEDIFLISKHFIENNKIAKEKDIKYISERAWQIIEEYTYPGNVRELLNILERAIIICEEKQIKLEHLPKYLTEKIKSNIERKYKKIASEKSKNKNLYEDKLVSSFNPLQEKINKLNILLDKIIRKKIINLEKKGCVRKFCEQIEQVIIMHLFKKLNGDIVKLSQMINMSYSTLKRRIKSNNIINSEQEFYKGNLLLEELFDLIKIIINDNITNNKKEIKLCFDIERKIIEITLNEMKWKKKDVCNLLGINYSTLNKNLIKYKINI